MACSAMKPDVLMPGCTNVSVLGVERIFSLNTKIKYVVRQNMQHTGTEDKNMFTRQHYKAIAEIVKHEVDTLTGDDRIMRMPICSSVAYRMAMQLAAYFQANPRFDREKFLTACGLKE